MEEKRNSNRGKSRRKVSVGIILRRVTGLFLVLGGLCIYLYPTVKNAFFEFQSSAAIREFRERFGIDDKTAVSDGTQEDNSATRKPMDEEATVYPSPYTETEITEEEEDILYKACFAYNCRIYAASQSGLKDVESYESFDLGEEAMAMLSNGMFGYLEIPAMDLILPLYLGASTEHMAAGAAILGETSVPIGGLNTNAVISGHRGYRGSPYFREIEKLKVGDVVYVTNPWGTLTYTVSEIDIISPQDADAVKIQEGRDMITLLTCHPYRSGGAYRYVVYCDRAGSESNNDKFEENMGILLSEDSENGTAGENDEDSNTNSQCDTSFGTEYIMASDGTTYVSSEKDIRTEQTLRLGSGVFLVILFFVFCVFSKKPWKKSTYK